MVVWLVAQGDLLLPELLEPLAVNLDAAGDGRGGGHILEDTAHVVEEPGHGQHDRGWPHGVPAVQEKLGILIALVGGLCEPVPGRFSVLWYLLPHQIQLA